MKRDEKELREYLRSYGSHSSAYSTLQAGLSHFVIPGAGYVPYAVSGSIPFCLSDPVCRASDYREVAAGFLKRFPGAVFIQVSEKFARTHHGMGFYCNEMGVETEIRVPDYEYGGRHKESLGRLSRKAGEAGVIVAEALEPEGIKGELEEVSRQWLVRKTISDRELWFVARRPRYEREPDVRKFVATVEGRVTGFVFFDPIYSGGRVFGYTASVLRAGSSTHPGTLALIMRHAIERFRHEAREVLSLGLSPFFDVRDTEFRHSRMMNRLFNFLYESGNSLYPFKGLSFAKSRYGGGLEGGSYRDPNVEKKKVYFAHRSRLPAREIYLSSLMAGVIKGLFPAVRSLLGGIRPGRQFAAPKGATPSTSGRAPARSP